MRRVAASFTVCLSMTGCALGPGPHASPQSSPGLSIHGTVHGGQQPIAGAHIYLLAANTTGYGGVGLAASALNASNSIPVASGIGNVLDRHSVLNRGRNLFRIESSFVVVGEVCSVVRSRCLRESEARERYEPVEHDRTRHESS